MNNHKKLFIGILSVFFMLTGIFFLTNWYVKKQIENALATQLPSSTVTYDEISVNILLGNSSLKNPVFSGGGFEIAGEVIELEDFSYSQYFFDGNLVIGHVRITGPVLLVDKSKSDTASTGSRDEVEQAKHRNLRIKKISVHRGKVKVIENDSVPNSIYLKINELELHEVVYNEKTEKGKIPFKYENMKMDSDSIYLDLNEEHYLTAGHLFHRTGDLDIEDLKIVPKYSRAKFDQKIPYEKDWIKLNVSAVSFKDIFWDTQQDTMSLKSTELKIDNADAQIYRNKLLPDDMRVKPLYSKMLRELGFKLHLENVEILNSKIVYEEKVLKARPPGKLTFEKVNLNIKNVSNINMNSEDFAETEVVAKALFMGKSTFKFDWKFDISNPMDEFTIQGSLAGIEANSVNSFLKPAMNVEIEGAIESLFFNFYGNRNTSSGEMQLAYRDFKIAILKDGKEKKKSFLSGIVNLFIKNDALNEDVKQENINIERNKTKSFWNFLWLSIREGVLKAFL